MSNSESASQRVVDAFECELAAIRDRSSALVRTLSEALEGSMDAIGDVYWEQIDELKGYLGSRAANDAGDDRQAQAQAIAQCESYVASHISNADAPMWVTAVIAMNGEERGAEIIREALLESATNTPVPH
jgi:hypothetical protein